MKEQVEITLDRSAEYHADGTDGNSSNVIVAFPPTRKLMKDYFYIKDILGQAVNEFQQRIANIDQDKIDEAKERAAEKENDSDDGSEMSGDIILNILYSSSVDSGKFFLRMQQLLKKTCTIDGHKIQDVTLDSMGLDGIEKLVGEYIAAFMNPSA